MSKNAQSLLFACAGILPAALIAVAAVAGGFWLWCAVLSMTVWVVLADRFGPDFGVSCTWSRTLPVLTGAAHFAALALTLCAVGQSGLLTTEAKILLVFTMGLYAGQVSNACAHELIHMSDRRARRLGTAIYCSILNGHHVSAHLLVHHIHAGTDQDPNSAPLGRGFYRYALEAFLSEYRAGLIAESARIKTGRIRWHPYVTYTAGALCSLGFAFVLGGGWAVVALIFISVHAQAQLLLSDYVQHYGLRRRTDATGKPEPMGPQHSWNAPQSYSSAMMLNATRHSDHHVRPMKSFAELSLDAQMPTLPRSMPVMATIALIPPLWRRIMDDRARSWSDRKADKATSLPLADPRPAFSN